MSPVTVAMTFLIQHVHVRRNRQQNMEMSHDELRTVGLQDVQTDI